MRIFHVLTRLLQAGSEENTIATCLGQVEAGHDVHVVHGRDVNSAYRSRLPSTLHLHQVESLVHPIDLRSDLRAFLELRALFTRFRPEVVHTHQSKAGIVGRFAAASARVPIVVHGVHILPFLGVGKVERTAYVAAERAAAAFTHSFINVSQGMMLAGVAAGIGKRNQHSVVHSGFDVDRFRLAGLPSDWADILGVNHDGSKPPTVLMLAAFEPRKRHLEFISQVHRIVEKVPNVRILLGGDGPLRAEVAAAIEAHALQGTVRMLGHRPDPERLIALADVCVLTSMREGLPRVLVQYLAAGKPTVICELPGLEELLDGHNAVVVGTDDLAGAASEITSLLLDHQRRDALAQAAAQTDVSSWSTRAMCDAIEAVYGSLINERKVRPALVIEKAAVQSRP